jgi:CDGSH-type Zn-finger protein
VSTRKEPFVVSERPGTRVICGCGRSEMLPYCDGSHLGSTDKPYVVEIEEEGRVAWCGCRRSESFPYCDGTHRTT